ncbi:MAG: energy-coupling factor transporter ATPase [Clostridiales bacterium]|nr:energy-coupling factor transporter ATPase [Clostridiales bacterium]
MSMIIKAEHISYSYPADEGEQPVEALRDVSFSVAEGEFVAVLGHNGCGKSTLAKILCMILQPGEGKLYIDGKDMTGDDITEEDINQGRRKVGMVFQNPDNQLVATIVEEDVAFGPENLGYPPEKIRRRVDWALETVGMTKYARHATHRLSGGQKQRIAIAGAIAMHRKCIIFDESTAMLDPHGRKEVMDTICRLNREEGITVIHITHYMNEATMADRVLVMQKGGIIMEGKPAEVFSRAEELWAAGLDVPQTTELLWHVRRAGYDVALDIFDPEACAAEIAKALKGTANGRYNT